MKSYNLLEKYYNSSDTNDSEIQIGVDEAGRGSLFGPVFVGAVIWDNTIDDERLLYIKDSKKLSKTKRDEMRQYIEKNALAWAVAYCDHTIIDEINILNSTYKAMHKALLDVYDNNIKFNRILVDGNKFKPLITTNGFIPHKCVVRGDNKYIQIAAASILAKTHHDEYINKLCTDNKDLCKYGLLKNQGYGTMEHRKAIKEYGLTDYHRKSFKINLEF
jgi:ribonuclease HII|tara:strand:- start:1866 stop:2519 length:654 start_codon:yes stop_codon:yes gene_type:complete